MRCQGDCDPEYEANMISGIDKCSQMVGGLQVYNSVREPGDHQEEEYLNERVLNFQERGQEEAVSLRRSETVPEKGVICLE